MTNELTKLATEAIRQLQTENKELKEQLDRTNEAVKLAFNLYSNGQVASEQLERKIYELSGKTLNEMEIVKQASVLTKVATNLSSFKLSNSSSYDRSSPEDRFNSFLMDDL